MLFQDGLIIIFFENMGWNQPDQISSCRFMVDLQPADHGRDTEPDKPETAFHPDCSEKAIVIVEDINHMTSINNPGGNYFFNSKLYVFLPAQLNNS